VTNIPVGAVKRANVADAYADQGMLEETLPAMVVSPIIQPVLNLPQKPPPARSGYMPGMVSDTVAAVALNISSVGLFNREDLSRLILFLHHIAITNRTGGGLQYNLRRDDNPVTVGMTFTPWRTSYSDAGSQAQPAVGMNTDSTETTPPGLVIGSFFIPAGNTVILPFEAVINNGQILVAPAVVNTQVEAAFFFRSFPIIQEQRPG